MEDAQLEYNRLLKIQSLLLPRFDELAIELVKELHGEMTPEASRQISLAIVLDLIMERFHMPPETQMLALLTLITSHIINEGRDEEVVCDILLASVEAARRKRQKVDEGRAEPT